MSEATTAFQTTEGLKSNIDLTNETALRTLRVFNWNEIGSLQLKIGNLSKGTSSIRDNFYSSSLKATLMSPASKRVSAKLETTTAPTKFALSEKVENRFYLSDLSAKKLQLSVI